MFLSEYFFFFLIYWNSILWIHREVREEERKRRMRIRKKWKIRFRIAAGVLLAASFLFSCIGKNREKNKLEHYPIEEFPKIQADLAGTKPEDPPAKEDWPCNFEEMKGVWISYLEYGRILTEKPEEMFRGEIQKMFDHVKEKGLNTVIVQVRSHGDAYYPSKYYPWSRYVTGTLGKDPGFDPLAIMVEEAHGRGLSIHGWINPYRLMQDKEMALLGEEYAIRKWYQNGDFMAKSGEYWFLNPGREEVQKLISDGVSELVENYRLDGIQIDDYFYTLPPQRFGQNEEDAQKNTTAMVKKIYQAVKAKDERILFGVSPAGNYTDKPRSDSTQYTDLTLWCREEGYLDYVVPQIYWDFSDPAAPFAEVLKRWEGLVEGGPVKLYIGLADYKFAGTEILANQIQAVEESQTAQGYLHFRYDQLS